MRVRTRLLLEVKVFPGDWSKSPTLCRKSGCLEALNGVGWSRTDSFCSVRFRSDLLP